MKQTLSILLLTISSIAFGQSITFKSPPKGDTAATFLTLYQKPYTGIKLQGQIVTYVSVYKNGTEVMRADTSGKLIVRDSLAAIQQMVSYFLGKNQFPKQK